MIGMGPKGHCEIIALGCWRRRAGAALSRCGGDGAAHVSAQHQKLLHFVANAT